MCYYSTGKGFHLLKVMPFESQWLTKRFLNIDFIDVRVSVLMGGDAFCGLQ